MYYQVQIRLIWMLIFLSCSAALNVFDSCEDGGPSCPTGSRCVWRGCDGRKCICESNLLPSLNKTSCVKETPLGEKCKVDSMCVGQPLSECRLNTLCSCLEGYKPSVDGTFCVLVMKGDDTAVEYGQYCDNVKYWCFPDDLMCANHRCVCEPGFRPATKEERYAEPYNTRHCRPKSFQLGVPVNISGAECQKPETPTTSNTVVFTNSPVSTKSYTLISSTAPSSMPNSTAPSTSTLSSSPPSSPTVSIRSSPSTSAEATTTTARVPSTSIISTTPKPPTTLRHTPSTTISTSTTKFALTTEPTSTSKKTATPSTLSTATPSTMTSSSIATTKSGTSTTSKIPTATTPPPIFSSSSSSSTSQEITQTSVLTNSHSETATSSLSVSTSSPSSKASGLASTGVSTKVSQLTNSFSASSSSTQSTSITFAPTNTTMPSSRVSQASSFSTKAPHVSTSATSFTPTTVGVGDKCHDKKCPAYSECVTDSCNDERCRCKLGYADSPDGKSCWKLSALGEECSGEKICQGQKTQCGDQGVCECEDGYERSDSGRWCRLKTSWFIDFPVVGEECSGGFFSQCYMQFEQQCVDGKCRCKGGLREITDRKDLDAMYPDIVQCRNNTFTIGAREEMLCFHQSRESRDYDMYERAKSKILRIQGGIIGGCVGFVALLGIVIGAVALIRWKRKGRREQIKDSSSTASTDATSRYSFKIPRPFTHFIGAKEYDSTQISYPNTVFDREEDLVQIDREPDSANFEPKPDVVNVGTLARQNQSTQDTS